jgi:excisionase family DNA binding protein
VAGVNLTLTLTDEQLAELAHQVAPLVLAELAEPGGPSPWLSLAKGAEYLGVSERTIEREIARGRLRSATLGRRRLLHRDDLETLARSGDGGGIAPTTPPRRRQGSRLRGANHSPGRNS